MSYKPSSLNILFLLIFTFFLGMTFVFNIFTFIGEQQFWYLAQSFLHGKLYFLEKPGYYLDAVYVNGFYYWPLGPFPAIVMMPLALLSQFTGLFLHQGFINFILVIITLWLSFRQAKRFAYSSRDALTLAFAFCFSSVYQYIAFVPWSGMFAQTITVTLLFLAIEEIFTKKRILLIGILFAAILMTRFTAGLGIVFFIALIWMEKKNNLVEKSKKLFTLLIPVFIAGVLLLFYNYVRFGNMFDNGYMTANNNFLAESQRYEQLHHGLFKFENIPTNIYYYFIKTLDPVLIPVQTLMGNTYMLQPPYVTVRYPGTSFFIVSPIFLYIFKNRLRSNLAKSALITCIIILIPLMLYYWPGWRQVGPRYMLDLLPFMYLLLLESFPKRKLSSVVILIIFASALLNFYLFSQVMTSANPVPINK